MTDRYHVHNMIAGMDVGEDMDLEVCKELIEKYGSTANVTSFISDNGNDITYREVVDRLNRCNKREKILKKSAELEDLTDQILSLHKQISLLHEIIQDNEDLVSDWFITNWDNLTDEMKHSAHLELGIDIEYEGEI